MRLRRAQADYDEAVEDVEAARKALDRFRAKHAAELASCAAAMGAAAGSGTGDGRGTQAAGPGGNAVVIDDSSDGETTSGSGGGSGSEASGLGGKLGGAAGKRGANGDASSGGGGGGGGSQPRSAGLAARARRFAKETTQSKAVQLRAGYRFSVAHDALQDGWEAELPADEGMLFSDAVYPDDEGISVKIAHPRHPSRACSVPCLAYGSLKTFCACLVCIQAQTRTRPPHGCGASSGCCCGSWRRRSCRPTLWTI